ncbi:MAG: hypothetical protein J6Y02_14445 [Pseudobutyrivibrio sp.]|nr:hypothetical protein [Pseudobutyrivibrio sp.]
MPIMLDDNQINALEQLRPGCILCGGVGSGKSRTALAYFYTKICGGDLDGSKAETPMDLYIITTARKRDDCEWEDEFPPFPFSENGINVKIDSWNNIGKYTNVMNAFFIFDEQRVVGSGAWVKAFLRITKLNKWILLSATPGDTWMDYIPVFIANGFYKNRTEFIRRHVAYNRFAKFPKVDHYLESGRLVRLRKSILVNMKYIKPTVSHNETVIVGYNRDFYKTALKNRWDPYNEIPVRDITALCYLLRKIVNSDPERINRVKELIEEHPKVIVFYNFDYELDILRSLGKEIGIKTSEWNGHKHEPVPSCDCWIYLVQYTAGAEGWNCTSTNAIIFYSQNYSYKTMIQAAGRIDRRNTPYSDLYYYHVRSNASIDLSIFQALSKKKNFNERSWEIS